MSAPAGRGRCRARAARLFAGACRDARLASGANFAVAGRSTGRSRGAKLANGIARNEHRVSFSMSRR